MRTHKEIMKLQTYKMFEGEDTVYVERDDVLKLLEQETCEDAISRQSAIFLVDDLKEDLPDDEHIADMVMAHNEGILEYQTQLSLLPSVTPQQKMGRWIPVSERLPKAGEHIGDVYKYYLVQNEYGDMFVARYTHSEYWEQIYQLQPIGDKIVAWMPLPEEYKEVTTDADSD